jgi:hypothetical protein
MDINKTNFPIEAIAAIDEILLYGRSKGYKQASWRKESLDHHVLKAKGHLMDYIYGIDRGEDHLECALCRLAMAVSVRRQSNCNRIWRESEAARL